MFRVPVWSDCIQLQCFPGAATFVGALPAMAELTSSERLEAYNTKAQRHPALMDSSLCQLGTRSFLGLLLGR